MTRAARSRLPEGGYGLSAPSRPDPPGGGLNAALKLAMLMIFAVLVLVISSPPIMLTFLVAVAAVKMLTGARTLMGRGVFGFSAAIFAAQVIFVPSGESIFRILVINITSGGILTGFMICGRFLSIILMSAVFVHTTRPSDLAAALSGLGVPYRYSFLLVLAMRMVPVFRHEMNTVREAQSVRGLRLDRGPGGIIASARYTTGPLLFSALSRVNSLSSSMEGRGFGRQGRRTYLRPQGFGPGDAAAAALAAAAMLAILILEGLIAYPV